MFEPELPIRTERLMLRSFVQQDLPAYLAYTTLPEVHRYLYTEVPNEDAARAQLEQKIGQTRLTKGGDTLCLAVESRDAGELLGEALLFWTSEQHRQAEIGYVFGPAHAGKGFATEAASVMLRLGIELGAHRVCARMDGRNSASARVAERLGMRLEARLVENELVKEEWTDEVIYATLASEYSQRVGGGLSRES